MRKSRQTKGEWKRRRRKTLLQGDDFPSSRTVHGGGHVFTCLRAMCEYVHFHFFFPSLSVAHAPASPQRHYATLLPPVLAPLEVTETTEEEALENFFPEIEGL